MADWSANVSVTALYAALLALLAARDVDAVTLGKTAYTNPPDGAIEYNRAGSKFREWSTGGAAYSDVVLSIAGGGTGAVTAAAARVALGLGSLATQNNNAVVITGGLISGVNLDAGDIVSGVLALNRGGTGFSLGLGAAGTYLRSTGAAVAFSAIPSGDLPAGVVGQFPIGGGCEWFTNAAPANFVLLDGTAVSRTVAYAALFALWGTTFGVGDGATTFNLPDMRKRMPIGKDAGTGSIDTIGKVGGAFDHTHTGPSHTHTGPAHTHTISNDGSHSHTVAAHSHAIGADGFHAHSVNFASGTENSDTDVQSGAGTSVASANHFHGVIGNTDGTGTHDHSGSTGNSSPATDAQGLHNHTGSTGSAGTGATGAAGTGATGTANPPFFTVNYIARYQ